MSDVLDRVDRRPEDPDASASAPAPQAKATWTRSANEPTATGPELRRSTTTIRTVDIIRLIGSALAAVGFTSWLFFFALPLEGALGFVLISYGMFLLLFGVLTAFDENRPTVRDRLASVVMHSLAFLLLLALFSVVIYTVGRGLEPLGFVNFFTQDMSAAGPLDGLDRGGILHAIVGTLIMITIALILTIPLGILTAVFLTEYPGKYARFVRTVVEAMTALPSIVAGLFVYAIIVQFQFTRSGFAAACAITVMMLPIVVRSADVVLRLVPGTLKEAARALGASTWRTVWTVTLPTSRSGLTTAVILGTARGIGETSPVLLTAGATTFFNFNPFVGAMTSLPLTTFSFVKSPELNFIARGFGTAAVLMVLVVILFLSARAIGGRGPGQLSPRQQRARANGSRDDDYRFRAKELGVTRSGAIATATPGPGGSAGPAGDVAGQPAASRSLVSRITAPVAVLRRRLSGRASTPTPPPESPPLPPKD